MKKFLTCMCVPLFSVFVAVSVDAQPTVYLVGNPVEDVNGLTNIDRARVGVYHRLLTTGLEMEDSEFNIVEVPGLGWEVTYVGDDEDSAQDAMGFDLIWTTEALSSSESAKYGDLPIPYITTEQILVGGRADREGDIYFTATDGGIFQGGGTTFVTIVDNTHPVTSLWDANEEIEVTLNFGGAEIAGGDPSLLAPAVNSGLVVTNLDNESGPPEFLLLGEAGASGLVVRPEDEGPNEPPPGFDPLPARRAFLGFHNNTVYRNDDDVTDPFNVAITPQGAILMQRVLQWMLGFEPTADGTPEGVELPTKVNKWSLY